MVLEFELGLAARKAGAYTIDVSPAAANCVPFYTASLHEVTALQARVSYLLIS